MKLQQLAMVSAVFVLASVPKIALADEVWDSSYGRVVYQSERGKTAIWTYPGGTIFIEGLAGITSNRGIYHGYWVGKSNVKCDTSREDASGKLSNTWGRFSIRFQVPNFPMPWFEPRSGVIGRPQLSFY
ncbi:MULTISPECIES: hypothetical protein [unclassified Nostoc]|uniref:hypothetical protein n=1 Tax=unclassified Nostoc TaxID=2593658 RepID=UPI002AD3C7F7|nr:MULTISPECIES: hypothetical protein [unclassified Nostoc]MDZ8121575.1 hypothetical protein [Nostoc sp. CmiVER01]MDZ8227256.1 hypothetical protein [Nostoc sp. ChiVER01]